MANKERNNEITRLYQEGKGLAELGRIFGITRQRVDLILKRLAIPRARVLKSAEAKRQTRLDAQKRYINKKLSSGMCASGKCPNRAIKGQNGATRFCADCTDARREYYQKRRAVRVSEYK